MVDIDNRQSAMFQSNCQISLEKIRSNLFAVHTNFSRIYSSGTLQLSVHVGESSQVASRLQPQVSASSSWNHSIDEETQVSCVSDYLDNLCMECKETERRRKIGIANKGKAPWNKGRKHSAETRALIKQRTIEALRDPKVRKKMSEGHSHSEESKAKIGLGQRRVWRKRNQLKYIKEKFYQIWAESIAVAAKSGWCDQEELEWDSYEKLTENMARTQLQLVADKQKEKEMAILRATRQKAEKMARLAQQKKVRAQKKERAKSEEVRKRARRKAKEEKEHPISKGFKLKIHRKEYGEGHVATVGDVTYNDQPAIEKLDLEFIRKEKLRSNFSLADQIQAAKKKRAESTEKEVPKKMLCNFIMNDRVEQLVSIVYSNKP